MCRSGALWAKLWLFTTQSELGQHPSDTVLFLHSQEVKQGIVGRSILMERTQTSCLLSMPVSTSKVLH